MKDRPLDRRHFAKRLTAGAAALAAGINGSNAQEKVNPDNRPVPLRRPDPAMESKSLERTNGCMSELREG